MTQSLDSYSLFTSGDEAARADAIDRLHYATAIYTAEPIVDELLGRLSWPNGTARLLDPACGDGIFLGRALAKLLQAHVCPDEQIPQIIEGWEVHPFACAQARSRLAALLIAHGRTASTATKLAEQIVHNRDFLTEGPSVPTWHVIAGNPPYLRWLNVPTLLREAYEACVPSYATGDMLHSFLACCTQVLHTGGEIGFVTADPMRDKPRRSGRGRIARTA